MSGDNTAAPTVTPKLGSAISSPVETGDFSAFLGEGLDCLPAGEPVRYANTGNADAVYKLALRCLVFPIATVVLKSVSREDLSVQLVATVSALGEAFYIEEPKLAADINALLASTIKDMDVLPVTYESLKSEGVSEKFYEHLLSRAKAHFESQLEALPALQSNSKGSLYGENSFSDGEEGCQKWIDARKGVLVVEIQNIEDQLAEIEEERKAKAKAAAGASMLNYKIR